MIKIKDGRTELYQWDTGSILTVGEGIDEVHFARSPMGRSITVPVVSGEAKVEDVLLQTAGKLFVWGFVGSAEDGYTKLEREFTVRARNKPADYVFTPPEQITLSEILEELKHVQDVVTPEAVGALVEEYLRENPVGGAVKIDDTLTMPGFAADAAAVGDAVEEIKTAIGSKPLATLNIINTATMSDGIIMPNGTISAASVGKHTDFIDVKPNDVLRIVNWSNDTENNLDNVTQQYPGETYDADGNAVARIALWQAQTETVVVDGISTICGVYTIPEGVYAVRLNVATNSLDKAMATINEPIPSNYTPYSEPKATDTALAKRGVPADAKATGDKIAKLEDTIDDAKAAGKKVDAIEDTIDEVKSALGIPLTVASGSAQAVSPAYAQINLASGISLKKDRKYEINAKATTESTDFSVYVFLAKEDGSEFKYLKITHDSVNGEAGTTFTADADYENMRLYFTTHLTSGCWVTAKIEAKKTSTIDITKGSLTLFNPFALNPLYHHLNQEDNTRCDIPAQSLFDVNYAKSLGFDMIEVNLQKCSDGVLVCKHGLSGTLGNGLKADDGVDYTDTKFSAVTSEWLRNHISYATIDKYAGHIPTLDEVCMECKKLSMMIKVSSAEAIEVARKYLPDNMIWCSYLTERGDFKGLVEYVWSKSETIDDCIAKCSQIGSPLNIVIAAGEFSTHTDATIKELTQKAHKNGFTVGMVYPTSSDVVRALSLGVDAICSTKNNINLFDNGDVINISHLNDSQLELSDGATYDAVDDVITMAESATLSVSADDIKSGKISLRIRYSGSITINDDMTYEGDGIAIIPYAVVLQRKSGRTYEKWISLKANSAAKIYEMSLSCSSV